MADDLDSSLGIVAIQLVENFVVFRRRQYQYQAETEMAGSSRERTLRFSNSTPSGAQVRSTRLLS